LRFDTARSLASGYSFVGAHAGAGVLPVPTGKRGTPWIPRLRSGLPLRVRPARQKVESDRIACIV